MSASPIERLLSLGKPHASRTKNERNAALRRRVLALKAATLPPRPPKAPAPKKAGPR